VFDSWMIEADLLMRWRAGGPCGCERVKPSPDSPSSHRPAKCFHCPAVCSVLPGRPLEWALASVRCHEPRLLLCQTHERGSFDEADAAHVRGGRRAVWFVAAQNVACRRNPAAGVLYCGLGESWTIVGEHCDGKGTYFLGDRIPGTPAGLGFEPDWPTPPADGFRAWMGWWLGCRGGVGWRL